MFLLARCFFHIHAIRHSSSSREFFATLKKFYRSTTSEYFMASSTRTCFVFDKDESTKLLIQMVYEIPSTTIRRKFNLFRSADESVSQTIRRLTANIEQATKKQNKKSNKRRQKEETSATSPIPTTTIQLLDENNRLIDDTQSNKHAWLQCRTLIINEQSYNVEYNAPAIIKFRFPDLIMSNTITTAQVELDYGHWEHSLFDWYVADELRTPETDDTIVDDDDDQTRWTHVHRGPFYVFRDEHVNKFVRLVCLPRNDSLREGLQADHTSKARIIPRPIDLPMDTRHQLTKDYFPTDSKSFRLVSYNILANGYASSTDAGPRIYPYCPQDYLEHSYRKPLLLNELLGYHADLISLQECDTKFFERELSLVLNEHGYQGKMKIKSEKVQEGEAIFYRTDRFTPIDTHDIAIREYLRHSEHLEYIRQRCLTVPEINTHLLERNTVLQILALQPREQANEILLICNTHLYYHPMADIVRCFQALIAFERIKEIKQFYEQQHKNVSIFWSGDFNANVTSLAFQLLFTGCLVTDTNHRSYNEAYETLVKDFNYKTSIELSTYSNYAYTNYMMNYHGIIDHIFFEAKDFRFERCIPMPTHEEVTEFTALPSCKIPSDHLAVVIELERIR